MCGLSGLSKAKMPAEPKLAVGGGDETGTTSRLLMVLLKMCLQVEPRIAVGRSDGGGEQGNSMSRILRSVTSEYIGAGAVVAGVQCVFVPPVSRVALRLI